MNIHTAYRILALSAVTAFFFQSPVAVANPDYPPPHSPSYTIETFRSYERSMLEWHQRWRQARHGSWEERHADHQRRYHGQSALDVISAPGALENHLSSHLEAFANDLFNLYRGAQYNSYPEDFYRQAMEVAWTGYISRIRYELQYDPLNWRFSVDTAKSTALKTRAAPYQSKVEAAYREVTHLAFQIAGAQLRDFIQRVSYSEGFRTFESIGLEMHQEYRRAGAQTAEESAFRELTRIALDGSRSDFQSEVRTISIQELYRINTEYDERYRQAPSNSLIEGYYKDIRDGARREIHARTSPTPPTPSPRNYRCMVTTSRTTYEGLGPSIGSATAAARNVCLRYETSFSCNAGSVVCRLLN